jgi:hypothetical protein
VTAAISTGQALVPGTNIEATTVGTQLSALNDSLTPYTKSFTIPQGTSGTNGTASIDISEFGLTTIISAFITTGSTNVFACIYSLNNSVIRITYRYIASTGGASPATLVVMGK